MRALSGPFPCSPSGWLSVGAGGIARIIAVQISTWIWRKLFQMYLKYISCLKEQKKRLDKQYNSGSSITHCRGIDLMLSLQKITKWPSDRVSWCSGVHTWTLQRDSTGRVMMRRMMVLTSMTPSVLSIMSSALMLWVLHCNRLATSLTTLSLVLPTGGSRTPHVVFRTFF